jgi:hypothetical protein
MRNLKVDRLASQPTMDSPLTRAPCAIAGDPVVEACRPPFLAENGGTLQAPAVSCLVEAASIVTGHVEATP